MSAESTTNSIRVDELRRAFDNSFAAPQEMQCEVLDTVLALSINGDRFALRSSQIFGIAKCGQLTAVPSRSPALLGLIGLRGELVPVFSLAELLGYDCRDQKRWLLLCNAPRLALAFADFTGCFKIPHAALSRTNQDDDQTPGKYAEAIEINATAHAIIEVSTLTKMIMET